MANKSDFSSKEWGLIKDSPYWVQTAITAAEGRMGLVEKRREAKALQEFLDSYKSSNELVKAVVAEAKDGKHDVNPDSSLELVGEKLEDIADAVEPKTSNREFDAFNDFLMDVGNAIASAMGENMLRKKDKISDEEEEALHLVATALRATDADRAKRASEAAAEARKRIEEQQKEAAAAKKAMEDAKQKAADARKAAAEEARRKRAEQKLADLKKEMEEAEEERKRREALAKKQEELREQRRQRMVEARKKAEEQKAAEEAAANTYVVQPGDTLSHIALDKLGSANAWRKIYEANKDKIKNPSLIYPGQELVIPSE